MMMYLRRGMWVIQSCPRLNLIEVPTRPGAVRWWRPFYCGALFAGLGILLLFLLCRRRKKFHGILTEESIRGIKVVTGDGPDELAQEVIDHCDSPEECLKALKESGAVTYLPADTVMEVAYLGRDGVPVCLEQEADEKDMYRMLGKLEGCGKVKVALSLDDRFEIVLTFWV